MTDETCSRCGQETDHTTLTGERLCPDCQTYRAQEDTTRDAHQQSLGQSADGDGS